MTQTFYFRQHKIVSNVWKFRGIKQLTMKQNTKITFVLAIGSTKWNPEKIAPIYQCKVQCN